MSISIIDYGEEDIKEELSGFQEGIREEGGSKGTAS
jgi:hypothetical protein